MSASLRLRPPSCGDAPCRDVPCVDGSGLARAFFTLAALVGAACVRPVSAVHLTAGHNALRGSGPGQKHAFENAVAHVGGGERYEWCSRCRKRREVELERRPQVAKEAFDRVQDNWLRQIDLGR